MDLEKTIIGKCPLCGNNVIKTLKGYACENSLGDQPSCRFFLFATIGNRRFNDSEAAQLLAEKYLLLDGFATKDGKAYTSILELNTDGSTNMNSQIGACPKCGGALYVGPKAVTCCNFKDPVNPCGFTIWRNCSGHEFTLSELNSLISHGETTVSVDTYDNQGNRKQHRFGLNDNKEVIRL